MRNFDFQDHNGNTPLYYAVMNKHPDAVRELLRAGVDVNVKCEHGNTALHRAMFSKDNDPANETIINMLLTNGVNSQ